MEVERRSKVVFRSTMERQLFPTKMAHDRFGNVEIPIRGVPHRGPGCYENEEKTCFWYGIQNKLTSNKGYTLGARTAKRSHRVKERAPCPTSYQTTSTQLKTFRTSKKPFEIAMDRFPVFKRDKHVIPGPGTYDQDKPSSRMVQWHQSFGGAPIKMPSIQVTSTIEKNTDKLLSTKEEKKYHRKLAYLKLYYD